MGKRPRGFTMIMENKYPSYDGESDNQFDQDPSLDNSLDYQQDQIVYAENDEKGSIKDLSI